MKMKKMQKQEWNFLNNSGITFQHECVSDSNTIVVIDWNGVTGDE